LGARHGLAANSTRCQQHDSDCSEAEVADARGVRMFDVKVD
jgi:hypothetical protein